MTHDHSSQKFIGDTSLEARILELREQLAELEDQMTAQSATRYYCGAYFPRPNAAPEVSAKNRPTSIKVLLGLFCRLRTHDHSPYGLGVRGALWASSCSNCVGIRLESYAKFEVRSIWL